MVQMTQGVQGIQAVKVNEVSGVEKGMDRNPSDNFGDHFLVYSHHRTVEGADEGGDEEEESNEI